MSNIKAYVIGYVLINQCYFRDLYVIIVLRIVYYAIMTEKVAKNVRKDFITII